MHGLCFLNIDLQANMSAPINQVIDLAPHVTALVGNETNIIRKIEVFQMEVECLDYSLSLLTDFGLT